MAALPVTADGAGTSFLQPLLHRPVALLSRSCQALADTQPQLRPLAARLQHPVLVLLPLLPLPLRRALQRPHTDCSTHAAAALAAAPPPRCVGAASSPSFLAGALLSRNHCTNASAWALTATATLRAMLMGSLLASYA